MYSKYAQADRKAAGSQTSGEKWQELLANLDRRCRQTSSIKRPDRTALFVLLWVVPRYAFFVCEHFADQACQVLVKGHVEVL